MAYTPPRPGRRGGQLGPVLDFNVDKLPPGEVVPDGRDNAVVTTRWTASGDPHLDHLALVVDSQITPVPMDDSEGWLRIRPRRWAILVGWTDDEGALATTGPVWF